MCGGLSYRGKGNTSRLLFLMTQHNSVHILFLVCFSVSRVRFDANRIRNVQGEFAKYELLKASSDNLKTFHLKADVSTFRNIDGHR